MSITEVFGGRITYKYYSDSILRGSSVILFKLHKIFHSYPAILENLSVQS